MKQLKTTIAKLKQDAFHAITIIDIDTNTKIVMNANGSFLAEQFGSVEGFFENLNEKEICNFQVQDRRKNGTTHKLISTYTVKSDNSNESKVMKQSPAYTEVQTVQNFGGGHLNGGLSMAEVNYRTFDHSRLVQELTNAKEKCERLEKDNRKLEIENLKHELEGKKSAVSAETLNSYAPMLTQLLPMLLGNRAGNTPAIASLGSPSDGISPLKQQFVQMITNTDESTIEYLITIAHAMTTNNEFTNELAELMTKHKLLEE